jgi:hypothetical protein
MSDQTERLDLIDKKGGDPAEWPESLRVPQYDRELRLADAEIAKWQEISRRLYLARGCKKNEHLRIQAEAAYLSAMSSNAPHEPRRE